MLLVIAWRQTASKKALTPILRAMKKRRSSFETRFV
jgi:hypothetical protein